MTDAARETKARGYAEESAVFYKTLRAQGVPATAAASALDAYVAALLAGDLPDEPWKG